jgi:alpha-beta hydrolase superfamily lysophospholipase
MLPFALALSRRAGDQLAVLRLKNRVRGWNGDRRDPVDDARWALARIREELPGLPVVVVGHSMGGRVALEVSGETGVVGIAALAPWVEGATPRPPLGTPVLLVHGSRDRITSPRRTAVLAERLRHNGIRVDHLEVQGGDHAMLRQADLWHRTVTEFVTDVLLDPGRTS